MPPLPQILPGASPELLAAAMVTLATLGFALLLQRRAQAAQERGNALEQQLQAERGAHADVENALAASHEVLCRLVRQQETVREAERTRIARDLHDELGHRLLSLRVELALQQAAVRGTSPAVHDKLTLAIANLDAVIRAVRSIVGGLRPIAQGQSLRQAAERHLADFARLHGLDYRFDADCAGDGQRNQEVDAVLFRVLQESLSNVARHAQATTVYVTLAHSAGDVVLKVEDDGIGPLALDQPGTRGCGVDGIRERAEAFGGTLSLAPGRRGGTVVCATLPLYRTPAPA
jgi:signal transduction histidine kinase